MKKIYLATSYTHKRRLIRWWRYKKVTKRFARLAAQHVGRYNFFSPITHSHNLVSYLPKRLDTHSFWLGMDFDWIDVCDELWVYRQSGWKESHGVQKEITYAESKGLPIRYI